MGGSVSYVLCSKLLTVSENICDLSENYYDYRSFTFVTSVFEVIPVN